MTDKVWTVMNDLEMVASKIVSAREIIDTAVEAIQKHDWDKAETLAMAAYEFLGYYLDEFDTKFKLAWQETVKKQNEGSKVDTTECKGVWNSFWEENYYPEEFENTLKKEGYEYTPLETKVDGYSVDNKPHSKYYYEYDRNDPNRSNPFTDKVKKWLLPVEIDGLSGEYFVSFPDDLMEATGLEKGDQVYWKDNKDGSYTITKVTNPLESNEC